MTAAAMRFRILLSSVSLFLGDNFSFIIASNKEVIVPLLGEFSFLLSLVICLRLKDLMECG